MKINDIKNSWHTGIQQGDQSVWGRRGAQKRACTNGPFSTRLTSPTVHAHVLNALNIVLRDTKSRYRRFAVSLHSLVATFSSWSSGMQQTAALTKRLRFQLEANFESTRSIAAFFPVVMSMMMSMAINLIGSSAGRSPLTQNLCQIEWETSSVTLLALSHVVHGLPDPHGGHDGGRRLLFGQVPLPELLVPGLWTTFSFLLLSIHFLLSYDEFAKFLQNVSNF